MCFFCDACVDRESVPFHSHNSTSANNDNNSLHSSQVIPILVNLNIPELIDNSNNSSDSTALISNNKLRRRRRSSSSSNNSDSNMSSNTPFDSMALADDFATMPKMHHRELKNEDFIHNFWNNNNNNNSNIAGLARNSGFLLNNPSCHLNSNNNNNNILPSGILQQPHLYPRNSSPFYNTTTTTTNNNNNNNDHDDQSFDVATGPKRRIRSLLSPQTPTTGTSWGPNDNIFNNSSIVHSKRSKVEDMNRPSYPLLTINNDAQECSDEDNGGKSTESKASEKKTPPRKDRKKNSTKKRLVWTPELHQKFVEAVNQLGINTAAPKTILQYMNVPGLTTEHIKSHLQKFRLNLKKTTLDKYDGPNTPLSEQGSQRSSSPEQSESGSCNLAMSPRGTNNFANISTLITNLVNNCKDLDLNNLNEKDHLFNGLIDAGSLSTEQFNWIMLGFKLGYKTALQQAQQNSGAHIDDTKSKPSNNNNNSIPAVDEGIDNDTNNNNDDDDNDNKSHTSTNNSSAE